VIFFLADQHDRESGKTGAHNGQKQTAHDEG
jgi:hypothetical protein